MPSSISRAFHPSRHNLNKISRIALELREVLGTLGIRLTSRMRQMTSSLERSSDRLITFKNHPKSSDRHNQRTLDEEDDCGCDCSLGDWPRGGVSSFVKGSIDSEGV
ncbi:hypothetical protein PPACK8108_LOCUS8881 [Phakopsora pachyrhizi]|uniref:Uncharacterized protein n=1 Tax=Phakopsora pachyrhizi TaxID=170000 RepID=A0AAV0AXD6_PHAPC|nr:hypothetical protein PPACK8108_LOCUS8881 [Phakopsora pachyrhizi]